MAAVPRVLRVKVGIFKEKACSQGFALLCSRVKLAVVALPVRELPRDEGADEDTHEEQGRRQRHFPVVLTHQVPLQEKGPRSDLP